MWQSDRWQLAKVADVCRLINGRAYNKNELLDSGRYPVLRVGNFFTNKNWYYSDLELEPDKYCDAGDLLYAWSASFGPRVWQGEKAIFHYHIWKVEPRSEVVDRDYLFYFFEWDKELICAEQGAGATMIHVSKGSMEARSIRVPPREEQKRIVAVLDQAFAALDRARSLAEANLADAEELFERQLAREFADAVDPKERVPFAQLCTALTPKTKIQRKEYLEDGAFPIVSQEADLVSGYWNDQSALMGLTKPVVVFGDHTRCLKYIDFDFVVGADGTKVLLPKSGIDPLYLYYGLRSVPLAEKGYARHFKFLKEVSLPKLELSEQGRVSLGLRSLEEEVTKLTAAYYDKLGELTDLRQSFLQKAFAGELT